MIWKPLSVSAYERNSTMSEEFMYVVHAHVVEDDQPDWIYASASSRECAEAIAREHTQLGLIEDGWSISQFKLVI